MGGLSIKARALRYLSMREHSRAELERKLARYVEDLPDQTASDQISRVLDDLGARGFIDERRAAEALVSARSGRFGNLRLRQDLRARGIPVEEAADALAGLADTELQRAREVWRKRFGGERTTRTASGPGSRSTAPLSSPPSDDHASPRPDAAERARQARFLAARGFSGDVIRRVIHSWDDSDDPC